MSDYKYLDEYVKVHNISDLDLYNGNVEIHSSYDVHNCNICSKSDEMKKYLSREQNGTTIKILHPPYDAKHIDLKVYSLFRKIIRLNIAGNRLPMSNNLMEKGLMMSYAYLVNMIYDHKQHKITDLHEYYLTKDKINVAIFCKYTGLFLDSIIKVLNKGDIRKLYFCCGECTNNNHDPRKIGDCIKRYTRQIYPVTEDEIEHMKKIKIIGSFLHNYPAEVEDINNLSFLDRQEKDNNTVIYNGEPIYIKEFGSIDEIYDKTYSILVKLLFNMFGSTENPISYVESLCAKSYTVMSIDTTNNSGYISNCRLSFPN